MTNETAPIDLLTSGTRSLERSLPARMDFGGLAKTLPGVAAIALLTACAYMLAALSHLPAPAVALLSGMAVSAMPKSRWVAPGARIVSRSLLRWGIVLLGATINFATIRAIGIGGAAMTIFALAITLMFGLAVGRLLGLDRHSALLSSAGVAICGATAIMAVAASLPRKDGGEGRIAYIVGLTTMAGAVAMIVLPILAHVARLDAHQTGIFLGATLHELGQAAGAGYGISEDVGALAVGTKLLRVMCLGPIVLIIASLQSRGGRTAVRPPLVPWYMVGFALLMIARGMDALPVLLIEHAATVSQACILAALVALGSLVSFRDIRMAGSRPAAVTVAASIFLAMAMLAYFSPDVPSTGGVAASR